MTACLFSWPAWHRVQDGLAAPAWGCDSGARRRPHRLCRPAASRTAPHPRPSASVAQTAAEGRRPARSPTRPSAQPSLLPSLRGSETPAQPKVAVRRDIFPRVLFLGSPPPEHCLCRLEAEDGRSRVPPADLSERRP